ncbi:MAG: SRPBCC family protein [Gemmatimonadota bacterium]|nr:SRPBCC family protein [Gemmatimonadota bacterium]
MTYQLTTRIELPLDRNRVFDFFADAENLGAVTPDELHFRIRTPRPIAMREGALIDYTIRLWGFPLRWRTRIARWNPPVEFVDEQLRGPYKSWIHTHRFVAGESGTTIIEDEVLYELRFGWLGRLIAPLVRRQLGRIFAYRNARVRTLLLAVPRRETRGGARA